jgi:hypothetical protein
MRRSRRDWKKIGEIFWRDLGGEFEKFLFF